VRRLREGGTVPAPGRPDRALQVIDARDLASWMLDLAENRVSGAFNGTAPIGQTTMGELDEWRSEHRPGKMSAEREEAIFRLLC
jgi:hypothetical protein